jgi:phosphoglycolate phosphatase-like HAD superfamily hydrolase
MIRFLRPFDPHAIRPLIFDLGGTLIDSRFDLIHSINAMLRHFGRPEGPGEVIATYVGDGVPTLVRRALGDPADEEFFKSLAAGHLESPMACDDVEGLLQHEEKRTWRIHVQAFDGKEHFLRYAGEQAGWRYVEHKPIGGPVSLLVGEAVES